MQSRSSVPYAVRRVLVTGGALGVLALTACGSTPSPGATGDAAGTVRPVTTQPKGADGALECPASLASAEGMTVPEKPQGVDGAARLLPDRRPESLVVCGYPVMDVMATKPLAPPFRLHKRTVATESERAAVVEALTWAPRWNKVPRACTAMAGDETAYLVGAAYGDAIVWVAAKADANSCSTTTNGDFTSGAPLGITLDAMFGERRPPAQPAGACNRWSWGRLGDDRSLAPAGDPKVTVCRISADGATKATELDGPQSAEVVTALRALATRPTGQTCEGSGKATDSRFSLVLTYAVGPAVRITVDPECDPAVLGTNLESVDAGDLVELVEQWSPPIPGPDPNGSVSSDGSVAPGGPVAPDAPTEVPGSTGGGSDGNPGMEPAPPSNVPMTR
jgi:hypothetical protein